jgi:hypothetical protein
VLSRPNGLNDRQTSKTDERFEVSTAVTMKNGVLWDVTPYGSSKNRRFGRTYRHHHQVDKNRQDRNNVSSNKQPKHAASYC